MKICSTGLIAACLVLVLAAHAGTLQSEPAAPDCWGRVKATIEGYLGRPYVWGATGLKSFDCSGFVWRVICENGVLIKRTAARKLYLSLPKPDAGASWTPREHRLL